MDKNSIDKPLYQWWGAFKNREEYTFWMQLSVALIGIVFFSSEIRHTYDLILKSKAVLSGDRSLIVAWGYFALFVLQACLITTYASLKAYNGLTNNEHEIWNSKFKRHKFGALTLNNKFMPARKFVENDIKVVTSKPKNFIFQNPNATQVIYHIAEDNTFIAGNYIFSVNSKHRILSIVVMSTIVTFVIGLISSSNSLLSTTAFAGTLLASLVMTEFFLAAVLTRNNERKVNKIIKSNLQLQDRVWLEYDLTISRNAYRVNNGFMGSLILGGIDLIDITEVDTSSSKVIDSTINSIESLVYLTCEVIELINNYDRDNQFDITVEQRREDIKDLLLILNVYLPACIKEVYSSLIKITKDEKIESKDLDVVTAYTELNKDLVEQNFFLLETKNRYEGTVKNTILNDFRKVIERRSKGWQGGDDFEVYSLKTQVLDTSLNQKLIPELEYMMKNADEESRKKIQDKIDEIRAFFDEQVALDEQAISTQMLEYDRSVTIGTNGGIVPTVDAVSHKLEQVDHYINGLKRSW